MSEKIIIRWTGKSRELNYVTALPQSCQLVVPILELFTSNPRIHGTLTHHNN